MGTSLQRLMGLLVGPGIHHALCRPGLGVSNRRSSLSNLIDCRRGSERPCPVPYSKVDHQTATDKGKNRALKKPPSEKLVCDPGIERLQRRPKTGSNLWYRLPM